MLARPCPRLALSFLLCTLPLTAFAACEAPFAEAVARRLGYSDAVPHQVACKAIPSQPDKTIVALAYLLDPNPEDDGESGDYTLDVLVVDSKSGAISSRFREKASYPSDAWRFRELQIDTARYDVAPQRRAFGVRAIYEGLSRVAPGGEKLLDLFVVEGAVNRRILKRLQVSSYNGEWDTICEGQWSGVERTIAIGATRTNGYADLLVTSTTEYKESKPRKDDCVEGPATVKTRRHTLRYDGKTYAIPAGLSEE